MSGPAWVQSGATTSTKLPFRNVDADYNVDNTDCVVNCTANTVTLTLPTAVGLEGQFFVIKNSGTGVVTVDGFGPQTMDDQQTKLLAVQYESFTFISDGANWVVV